MTRRSVEARKQRAKLKAAQTSLALADDPPLEPAAPYPERLKTRVRLQVELVCCQLDKEACKPCCDGAKLDRLASALERLAELERVLDGRPGPGNRRPPREDPPAARPAAAPRPPAIPTPASATQPAAQPGTSEPAPPRLLSEPPEF